MKRIVIILCVIFCSCSDVLEEALDNIHERKLEKIEEENGPQVDFIVINKTPYNFTSVYLKTPTQDINLGPLASNSYSTNYEAYYILDPFGVVTYYNGIKFSYIPEAYIVPDTIREGTYHYEIEIADLKNKTLKLNLIEGYD